jgi:pimeloyl-ACP methyl ester carboxylesterase
MSRETKTIVLIHGLWMTPRSWENFRRFYTECGYQVLAPAWPGLSGEVEYMRQNSFTMDDIGIAEIAAHYALIVRNLDEPPILMGHSFGGLVVQLLLDRGLGAAGVAIASAPPRGVLRLPWPMLKASSPVLSNPFNYKRTVPLTFAQFYYGFANVMTEQEAHLAYERYVIPGPGRPIFQAACANLNPWSPAKVNYDNADRTPLLLIAGSEDHQVPASVNRANYKKYARSKAITDYKKFSKRSHLIIAQKGWQEVAEYALSWVRIANAQPQFETVKDSDQSRSILSRQIIQSAALKNFRQPKSHRYG